MMEIQNALSQVVSRTPCKRGTLHRFEINGRLDLALSESISAFTALRFAPISPRKKAALLVRMLYAGGREVVYPAKLLREIIDTTPGMESVIVSAGTPGPYQKSIAITLDSKNTPISIVKISTTSAPRALIRNEARWLKKLKPILGNYIPDVLAIEETESSTSLHQTYVSGWSQPQLIQRKVSEFIDTLASKSRYNTRFSETNVRQEIEKSARIVRARIPATRWKLLEDTIISIDRLMAHREIQTVIAHRDLTPWNIKYSRHGGLKVFDWEFARDGYLPLHDLLHFTLMPRALSRFHRWRPLAYISFVEEFKLLSGLALENRIDPRIEMLTYFVDVCLTYLESRGGWIDDDIVINKYMDAISRIHNDLN